MADDPILIAGGGIAGLAAALGLARIGRECLVLERSAQFEDVGAGIQLGPNAVKALAWLGAWDVLRERTFAPRRILVRDGLSGRKLQDIPLGPAFARRFGEPYRVAHRAELQDALLTAAASIPRISIKTASEVARCIGDRRSIQAELSNGHAYRSTMLIGADGIHSGIRAAQFDRQATKPRAHMIYRAMIPVFGGLSDDTGESVCLWLCPGGHVVHYPIAAGTQLNIVAACERPPPASPSGAPAESDEVLAAFRRSCEALRMVLALPNAWRSWPAADRPPRPGWHRGRIVLIGDAAHPALPYLAQGAAMALEDACALARVIEGRNSGFAKFEALRFRRTARVQGASRRLRRVYHASGLARQARNALLGAVPADRFLDRLAWIYGHDPVNNMSAS